MCTLHHVHHTTWWCDGGVHRSQFLLRLPAAQSSAVLLCQNSPPDSTISASDFAKSLAVASTRKSSPWHHATLAGRIARRHSSQLGSLLWWPRQTQRVETTVLMLPLCHSLPWAIATHARCHIGRLEGWQPMPSMLFAWKNATNMSYLAKSFRVRCFRRVVAAAEKPSDDTSTAVSPCRHHLLDMFPVPLICFSHPLGHWEDVSIHQPTESWRSSSPAHVPSATWCQPSHCAPSSCPARVRDQLGPFLAVALRLFAHHRLAFHPVWKMFLLRFRRPPGMSHGPRVLKTAHSSWTQDIAFPWHFTIVLTCLGWTLPKWLVQLHHWTGGAPWVLFESGLLYSTVQQRLQPAPRWMAQRRFAKLRFVARKTKRKIQRHCE